MPSQSWAARNGEIAVCGLQAALKAKLLIGHRYDQ